MVGLMAAPWVGHLDDLLVDPKDVDLVVQSVSLWVGNWDAPRVPKSVDQKVLRNTHT